MRTTFIRAFRPPSQTPRPAPGTRKSVVEFRFVDRGVSRAGPPERPAARRSGLAQPQHFRGCAICHLFSLARTDRGVSRGARFAARVAATTDAAAQAGEASRRQLPPADLGAEERLVLRRARGVDVADEEL